MLNIINQLEILQFRLELLIFLTPSGGIRNEMTNENIKTLALIKILKEGHNKLSILNNIDNLTKPLLKLKTQ